MKHLKIIRRTPKNKGLYLIFSQKEGFVFINRKEVFYYANIFCKSCLPEEKNEIRKIVEDIKNTNWIKDPRLKNNFTHRVELNNYPELNIRVKKAKKENENIKDKQEKKEDGQPNDTEPTNTQPTDTKPNNTTQDDQD